MFQRGSVGFVLLAKPRQLGGESRDSKQMTTDIDIYRTANALIGQHGDEAPTRSVPILIP